MRRCKTLHKIVEMKDEPTVTIREISLRKGKVSARLENKRKFLRQKGRKTFAEGGNRQAIALKGPRVKNVCRSASVVLGQQIATFPQESSPKKQSNESANESKLCDKSEATIATFSESQEVSAAVKNKENLPDRKQTNQKSSISSKNIVHNNKPSPTQQTGIGRTKRKANVKTENPISIDFWETYDPEEVCETGFGLIGSENFSVRALCFLCGSSGQEKVRILITRECVF